MGITFWWKTKSDEEKSRLMVESHQYEKAIEYDQENSDAWMERSVAF
jgi:hypothetical protein